jgi:hypothetical protein
MRCVEDALRELAGKAALIQYLADCAVEATHLPAADAQMFNGLGDVCAEIAQLVTQVKAALGADALGAEVRSDA